jgi:hypothetical protein
LARRQRTSTPDALPKRLSLHIRHREEYEVVYLVHRVDRYDVRVGELRGRLSLTKEAIPQVGLCGVFRRKELERHRPVESNLVRQIHDAHATAAELLNK